VGFTFIFRMVPVCLNLYLNLLFISILFFYLKGIFRHPIIICLTLLMIFPLGIRKNSSNILFPSKAILQDMGMMMTFRKKLVNQLFFMSDSSCYYPNLLTRSFFIWLRIKNKGNKDMKKHGLILVLHNNNF